MYAIRSYYGERVTLLCDAEAPVDVGDVRFVALQRAAHADIERATPLLREGWRDFEAWAEEARIPAENAARLEVQGGRPRDRSADGSRNNFV